MAKAKSSAPNASSRRWIVAAVAALVVLVAAGIYLAARSSRKSAAASGGSSAPAQRLLDTRVILPAIPRRPRPLALSPEQFPDAGIRKSYEIARNNPLLLEQMPCYCGCYMNPGHTNNLDCFVDKHGET